MRKSRRLLLCCFIALFGFAFYYATVQPGNISKLLSDNTSARLLADSIREVKLDDLQLKLFLATDEQLHTHAFLVERERKVLTQRIIFNYTDDSVKVDWGLSKKMNHYSLLSGRIVDPNIEYIKVAGVQPDELKMIDYNNQRIFYSTSPTIEESPLKITGLSKEGGILYKSYP